MIKNLEKVEVLKQLAKDKDTTSAQLAIAWVNARGAHIMPLVSMSKRSRLLENIAAMDISFSAEEMKLIKILLKQAPSPAAPIYNAK